jgi:hypothetical protein
MPAGRVVFFLHSHTLTLQVAALCKIPTQWALHVRPGCRLDPPFLLVRLAHWLGVTTCLHKLTRQSWGGGRGWCTRGVHAGCGHVTGGDQLTGNCKEGVPKRSQEHGVGPCWHVLSAGERLKVGVCSSFPPSTRTIFTQQHSWNILQLNSKFSQELVG